MSAESKRLKAAAAVAAGVAVIGFGAVEGRHALRGRRKRRRRYRLAPDRPLGADLRRVLDGRFEVAIAELEHRAGEREAHVHDARTTVKRLRSALRLVREDSDRTTYDEATERLRDAAHELGAARDATAAAEALDGLARRYPDRIDADELARLRERIGADAERANSALEAAAGRSLDRLREARAGLADWPRAEVSPETLAAGLQRSFKRGRSAQRAAVSWPSDENFHAWRRRVKDLRYQAELLRDLDQKRLRKLARRADRLAELLGEDHDLAGLWLLAADAPHTLELIGRRRARLRRAAVRLGDQIYAKRPRTFARRLAFRGQSPDSAAAANRHS